MFWFSVARIYAKMNNFYYCHIQLKPTGSEILNLDLSVQSIYIRCFRIAECNVLVMKKMLRKLLVCRNIYRAVTQTI